MMSEHVSGRYFEREMGRRKEAGLLGRAGLESDDGRPLLSIIDDQN
jgi:hypothetical protein